jgi:lipopolysaccharide export LptBFGC system permease protein LptF
LSGGVEKDVMASGTIVSSVVNELNFAEPENPFAGIRSKPSQLTASEVREQIKSTESETEQRALTVALEKKYATLVLPLVIALFTAPFSLSLSRKGKAATVGYAVGLWLLFMGIGNLFEQLGYSGTLTPTLAVWSPLVIFALFGTYLLSKVRT